MLFDWVQNKDLRSFDHLAPIETVVAPSMMWTLGPVMSQGNTGSCTGHGTAGAISFKHASLSRHSYAMALYELATSRDPYPGDWPTTDSGSSVNGAMRAARDDYRISSWTWATDLASVKTALTKGPLVMGSPWFNSMDDPTAGRLIVDPASGVRGGHCFCLRGYDDSKGSVLMRNSWGTDWGANGEAWIPYPGLVTLLEQGAEIAAPVVR